MDFVNFKNACKAKNTSPTALALKYGLSRSNVTRWSNGGEPSMPILLRMASDLEVSVDYLLGNKKSPADDKISEARKRLINLAETANDEELDFLIYQADLIEAKRRGKANR